MHRRRSVDLHILPSPAVGVNQGRLTRDHLALAAAETAATTTTATAARGRKGHHTGDAIHAHHGEVFALRIDRDQRAKLWYEFAQLARIDTLAHRADLGKPQLRPGIQHAWIHTQPFPLDHADALRRNDF